MTETICNLAAGRVCKPCEGGIPALTAAEELAAMARVPQWSLAASKISRRFIFANHYQAMAFVNAVAWISHRENHHPSITIGYKDVEVVYWTHAINGLSENDFICAEMVDKI